MSRIFGPVPSRRLGRSLGIDVIPHKTCTFDCVYCECGPTTSKIHDRQEFYPLEDLVSELDKRLSDIPDMPDVITLSGAGEPTLYSKLGELIHEAKKLSGCPVAVITNSSLLNEPEVREEMLEADIVLPSLDAAIEDTFIKINRPHPRCKLSEIIKGLDEFLKRFKGKVLFEVLLLKGYNTDKSNLAALIETLKRFPCDRLQLNTAVRPGAVKGIKPLDAKSLVEIRDSFGSRCEIIASPTNSPISRENQAIEEKIISLLQRRPCTAKDIHGSLGIPLPGVIKIVESLLDRGLLVSEAHGEDTFFTAAQRDS